MGNWRIKRQVLEGEDIAYKFTPKYVLRSGQTVWAAGAGATQSPHQPLCGKSQSSLGSGESFRSTVLVNDGEEMAVQAAKQSSVPRKNAEDEEEDLFHQQEDPRTNSRGCQLK